MGLPPILIRELNYRARFAKTWWIRVGVAGGALLGWIVPVMLGRASVGSGRDSLLAVTLCPFVLAAFCGVAVTADSISSEKRAGTLPLLLLTLTRPSGILLQKTFAAAAPFFSGLIAVFPLYALPVMLGGLSGTDVLGVVAMTFGTALVSIGIGLVSSCLCRSMAAAILLTFAGITAFFGTSFVAESLEFPETLSLMLAQVNPVHAYVAFFRTLWLGTFDATTRLLADCLAWATAFFFSASLLLPRSIRDFIPRSRTVQLSSDAGWLLFATILLLLAFLVPDHSGLLAIAVLAANLGKLTVLLTGLKVLGNRPWIEVILTTPLDPLAYVKHEFRAARPLIGAFLILALATSTVALIRLPPPLRGLAAVVIFFVLCDSVALGFVGLWNGIACRSGAQALSTSISSVILAPVIIALISMAFGFKTATLAGGLLLWTLLGLAVDLLLASAAGWMLQNRLRTVASTRA